MDNKKILTCKEGSSNKYWQYEIISTNPPEVKFSWGRIGLDGQSKAEIFPTVDKMHQKIAKKMAEKEKKGYTETDKTKLKKESEIAQLIGPKNKINNMHFVMVSNNDTFREINNYDPNQSVLIEIIDSWTKNTSYYLLDKKQSWQTNIDWDNKKIVSKFQVSTSIIDGIRKSLEAIAAVVKIAVQKFGLGIRALQIDDEVGLPVVNEDVYSNVFSDIGESVSKQVISKFASLGTRSLELD
jgi:predicted DNA-binding WGR domain protein